MITNPEELDISTLLVHAGERRAVPNGLPVSTPIYATATFTYDSMAKVDQVFAGEEAGYIYTRYGNPTVAALEEAIKVLEHGVGACGYASGMAALHAAIFCCELRPESAVLASQDLYGATTDLLFTIFGAAGVKTVTTDFSDLEELQRKARDVRPRVMIVETISNPLLKICDLKACAEIAHGVGARLIVDNTFASPYLCQPLQHGADLVVHSATKYLSGHADTMGGLVITKEAADVATLIGVMKLAGGVLGVWAAHEILRGIKTLGIRIERQCSNAARLAEYFNQQPLVSKVHYPGLATTAGTEDLIKSLLRGHAGALISIELRENTTESAFRFMDALKLCVRSTSLGDVFTGVLHPATASHREVGPARRKQLGISDGLVRISVGIEEVTDLIDDLEQALQRTVS
jgi:cystathionine gamma-synthase